MFKSKLIAVELTAHGELYPKVVGVLIKGSDVYRITLLSLEPLAFEIVRNNKVVAGSWYPETDGKSWPRGDLGVLFCLVADKH